ncbi:MAG TPA: hypothetical protein VIV40_11495 [Kofleriaceae bacterium]
MSTTINMSRALGIAGMGIGLAELVAPSWLSKQLGVEPRAALMRAMGAREVASGLGIVARHNPTPGQWTRVLGDVVDIALLGLAFRKSRKRTFVLGALGAVLAISALDLITARRL